MQAFKVTLYSMVLFLLAACASLAPEPPVLPAGTPMAALTATADSTATQSPPAPGDLVTRVGRGTLNDLIFSKDGQFVLAAYSAGLTVFHTHDLSQAAFLPVLDGAQALGLTPDGQQVAIGTLTGQVLLARFDPGSGSLTLLPQTLDVRPQFPMSGEYPNQVFALSISADGKIAGVASGSQAQFWDLASGQPMLAKPLMAFGPDHFYAIHFSAKSVHAWLADSDGRVARLVNIQSDYEYKKIKGIGAFQGDYGFVTAQAESYASKKYSIKVYPLANDGLVIREYSLDGRPDSLLFSQDGKTLAAIFKRPAAVGLAAPQSAALVSLRLPSSSPAGGVVPTPVGGGTKFEFVATLVDSATGKVTGTKTLDGIPYSDMLLSAQQNFTFSGDWLLARDWGEEFFVLQNRHCVISGNNLVSDETKLPFPKEQTLVGWENCRIVVSADQQRVAFFNPSGLLLLKAGASQALKQIDSHPSPVTALSFSNDDLTLAVGRGDTSAQLFQSSDGLELLREQILEANPCCAYRAPVGISRIVYDGAASRFGLVSTSGNLHWLSVSGDNPAPLVAKQKGDYLPALYGLAISPDGDTLSVSGDINAVRLRKGFGGGLVGVKLLEDSSSVPVITYAPDGQLLAAGTEKGVIRLWNPASLKLERSLWGHGQWVSGLGFDATGQKLYSVSEDGTARVWLARDGTQEQVLELNAPASSMALDPRGLLWAIGTRSGMVYFWNMQTAQWAGHLQVGAQPVWAMAFSGDGARLALGTQSGQLELWQVRDASGTVAVFPQGGPQKQADRLDTCLPSSEQVQAEQQDSTFVLGASSRLEWDLRYRGDCSAIDETSLSKGTSQPEIVKKFTLKRTPAINTLHITAEISPPAAGWYEYAWQVVTPGKTTTLTANFNVAEPAASANLPAALVFIDEDGALMRLEKDGSTLTPVMGAPVQCMDLSSKGELAYLSQDSLWLADANGGNRRALLDVAGCPAWSADGSRIAFILNGVKVLDVAAGAITTLDVDMHVAATNSLRYLEVVSWSPASDRLIVHAGGYEWDGTFGFEVANGNKFSASSGGDTSSWSRDGQYIYGASAEFNGYYGDPAGIFRTDIATGEQDILLGNGQEDSNGGFAPFETLDGHLLVFASQDTREPNPCGQSDGTETSFTLHPARMTTGTLGKFSYDQRISFPSNLFRSVLWWQDGRAAILALGCEQSSSTTYHLVNPFAVPGSSVLPIRGSNLRWAP